MLKYFIMMAAIFVTPVSALQLKITDIIQPLNIYILENHYVVQTKEPLSGYWKHSSIEIDMDYFYAHDAFQQRVLIKDEVETTKKMTTTVDNGVEETTVETYITEIEDASYFRLYTFTPLGVLKHRAFNRIEFYDFAASYPVIQPIAWYKHLFEDVNWFNTNKEYSFKENFPAAGSGQELSLLWLHEGYSLIDPKYNERIFVIYNKNFPEYMSYVLYTGRKRKVFLHDRITSLARFQ